MKAPRRKPDVHLRHAIRRHRQWQDYEAFREQLRQAGEAFRYAVAVLMGRSPMGATLPEKLPTSAQSIPQLERAEHKRLADERRELGWPEEGDVES